MTVLTKSDRERLQQAVVFFASRTRFCGKIKLFKLLYLFDFEHFRQTGRSATGLDYQAWKFGPVPVEVMEQWEDMDADLASLVHIAPEQVIDYVRQTVKVNDGVTFDQGPFSKRHLRILSELAETYRETQSPKMIDVTHAQNGAWEKVWKGGIGAHEPIPYELAIDTESPLREHLLEIAKENQMYRAAIEAARQAEAA